MMSSPHNARHEALMAAGFRLGRKVTLRAVANTLAERDKALTALRAELQGETRELRALLDAAADKVAYLQRLDAAAREIPPQSLH